jgi:hypothetical protein
MWEIKSKNVPGESVVSVALFHRKANNGPQEKAIGFDASFAENALSFSRTDVGSVPEFRSGLTLPNQIKSLLKGGALTVADIAEELDQKEATVRSRLNDGRGKSFSQIDQSDGSRAWGLLSREEDS